MLNLTFTTKIHVYTAAVDMRKGVHGLNGMVRSELAADPTDGTLFVFINRRRDRMKILHFDGGGFWLHYRLLEAGLEELQQSDPSRCLIIEGTQWAMLLSGVSLASSHRRRKRYARRCTEEAA